MFVSLLVFDGHLFEKVGGKLLSNTEADTGEGKGRMLGICISLSRSWAEQLQEFISSSFMGRVLIIRTKHAQPRDASLQGFKLSVV